MAVQVGTFDPYSDDPRLAVKKVWLCADTGTLAVAGTAGHVIIAKLNLEADTKDVKVCVKYILWLSTEYLSLIHI